MVQEQRPPDLISNLPHPSLCKIISLLPVQEAARTSVLARQWKFLWTSVPRLHLDLRVISKPIKDSLIELQQLHDRSKGRNSSSDQDSERIDEIGRFISVNSAKIVSKILKSHQGSLIACRITHFPVNLTINFKIWIKGLVERKKVEMLELLCELLPCMKQEPILKLFPGIFNRTTFRALGLSNYAVKDSSPFQGCTNLKTLTLIFISLTDETLDEIILNCALLENLKLFCCTGFTELKISNQNLRRLELLALSLNKIEVCSKGIESLVFDTISCPVKEIMVDTPNLRLFRAYCNPQFVATYLSECSNKCLKAVEILEHCSGISGSELDFSSSFRKLQGLSVAIDLNNVREAVILAYMFRLCTRLKKLSVSVAMDKRAEPNLGSENRCLPYPEYLFWERREVYESISFRMKFLSISGFKGEYLEIEFVKHLITKCTKMKRIVIQFDDDTRREGAIDAKNLLLLPRASMDATIVLKPGPRYLAKYGGNFEDWISKLKGLNLPY